MHSPKLASSAHRSAAQRLSPMHCSRWKSHQGPHGKPLSMLRGYAGDGCQCTAGAWDEVRGRRISAEVDKIEAFWVRN